MRVAVLTADSREHYKNYVPSIPSFGAAPTALLEGFQHLPNVEIHVISCLQKPVKSPEKLAANLWYHGLFVPKIGWLRTGYQGCVRATRRKIREIRADIVHGQGTERDCSLSAILSGRPNVVTIHGNMVSVAKVCGARMGSFNWWAARLEDFTLRRTAGVFCNSAYTESLVRPRARQTWRVPNAVRSAFLSTPAPRAARAVPMLLNIGEVCAYKRQRNVLEVARNLWRQGLRFELNFIGVADRAGAYATEFLNELREAEAAGYARHRGLLGLEQLMGALDEASALIHFPSEESFGLVVAEALARNLKLFTAATGGLVDIAERVEGAEIYPADDWKGLEAGIARWISAGHPRPSSAADVIRERYRPERIAERHLEIYAEVLKGGAGRF
jgi:glycosyltransferase involved in cell wall biosynthesis